MIRVISAAVPAARLGLGVGAAALAGPALAAFPDGVGGPVAGVAVGLAAALGVAVGVYALHLRRRVARLEAAMADADARRRAAASASAAEPLMDEGIERHFRRATGSGQSLEAWIDPDGRFFWVSPAIERYTGRPASEMLRGDFIQMVVYERDRAYCREQLRAALHDERAAEFELRLVDADAGLRWMGCHWQPIRDEAGRPLGLRVTLSDIQARKEAEYKLLETVAALRRAQALSEHYLRRSNEERSRLSTLLDVVRTGILFMDADHRVVYCNRALYDIWGMPESESFVGVRDAVLQQHVLRFVADPEAYMDHVHAVLAHRMPSEAYEIAFKDGRLVTDCSRVVQSPGGGRALGRVWVFEDVTEARRAARQLQHMAERDPLTNLFNRRRFHEELERMLADGQRHHESVGLLAIDLDDFKPVNDRFGHQAGDTVLVSLAHAIGAVVRRNEMFFRLGGDEFAILVPAATQQALAELARRVCGCVAALRFQFEGHDTAVTASIGIALGACRDGDPGSLIGAADRAMYLAKALGGNCFEFAREDDGALVDTDVGPVAQSPR